MTFMIHVLKKTASIEFYIMELRKMGVILRCKLVMDNEQNVKLAICQLVPNYYYYYYYF